jgi:hypothetical protein
MNDLLEWISRNNDAAFFIGLFILILVGLAAEFLVKMTRAVTGHYPSAPASLCDADDPCYCCRDGECDPGCRCNSDDEDGA